MPKTMQPIPKVARADVERVVQRDFPPDLAGEAFIVLTRFTSRNPHRVHLAALKLAAGDLDRLRHSIEIAMSDWRDVLLEAEYPLAAKEATRLGRIPEEEEQRIYDADWRQYEEWLTQ